MWRARAANEKRRSWGLARSTRDSADFIVEGVAGPFQPSLGAFDLEVCARSCLLLLGQGARGLARRSKSSEKSCFHVALARIFGMEGELHAAVLLHRLDPPGVFLLQV